jgi:hypothetical protein
VNPGGSYGHAIRGFAVVFIVVGALVLVVTLVNGGGPASVGFLMGLAFLLVGIGRLWLATRSER